MTETIQITNAIDVTETAAHGCACTADGGTCGCGESCACGSK